MKLQLVVAAILVVSAAAEPFESFSADPAEFGWVDGGRASPDTPLHFSVFVKQQHVDLLQQVLHEVADPDSPKFGQHLSNVEVHRLVEPSVESVTAVEAFLARAGVAPSDIRRSLNDDVLSATVSVAAAERLLGAEYHVFTHTASNITLVRTLQYELPEALQQHVDMVSPTVRFPHVFFGKRQGQTEERLRGSAGLGVTPTSLQQLFKTEGVTGRAPGNLQACTGFLSQFISPDDVQKFFKQFAPSESGKTFTVNGPNTPSQPGIEASLDVEYIMSVGSNVKTIFWSKAGEQPGNPANEPFLAWLEDVAALPDDKVPKVFSASYGDNEPGAYLSGCVGVLPFCLFSHVLFFFCGGVARRRKDVRGAREHGVHEVGCPWHEPDVQLRRWRRRRRPADAVHDIHPHLPRRLSVRHGGGRQQRRRLLGGLPFFRRLQHVLHPPLVAGRRREQLLCRRQGRAGQVPVQPDGRGHPGRRGACGAV